MFAASAEVVSGVSCAISGRVQFHFNYAERHLRVPGGCFPEKVTMKQPTVAATMTPKLDPFE